MSSAELALLSAALPLQASRRWWCRACPRQTSRSGLTWWHGGGWARPAGSQVRRPPSRCSACHTASMQAPLNPPRAHASSPRPRSAPPHSAPPGGWHRGGRARPAALHGGGRGGRLRDGAGGRGGRGRCRHRVVPAAVSVWVLIERVCCCWYTSPITTIRSSIMQCNGPHWQHSRRHTNETRFATNTHNRREGCIHGCAAVARGVPEGNGETRREAQKRCRGEGAAGHAGSVSTL